MIEVNDYVRTKNKGIRKIDRIDNNKQLIDLIEEGDYVNGHLVCGKYTDTDDYGFDFISLIIEDSAVLNKSIKERDIKTILTKEQYIANCYKVGGE